MKPNYTIKDGVTDYPDHTQQVVEVANNHRENIVYTLSYNTYEHFTLLSCPETVAIFKFKNWNK